jgi:hypothetical protein
MIFFVGIVFALCLIFVFCERSIENMIVTDTFSTNLDII